MRLFGLKHFYKRVTVTVDSPYLRHPIQLSHIFYIEVSYEIFLLDLMGSTIIGALIVSMLINFNMYQSNSVRSSDSELQLQQKREDTCRDS